MEPGKGNHKGIFRLLKEQVQQAQTIQGTITSRNTKQTIGSYIVGLYYKVIKIKGPSDKTGI